jgi:hypothetical protein
MRNPIPSSPDRPIPLPDCILLDAWWADLKDEDRVRREMLRVIVNREPRHERDADAHR